MAEVIKWQTFTGHTAWDFKVFDKTLEHGAKLYAAHPPAAEAIEEKAIEKRFTFHDLRAYYVTRHKAERGALPDLHANPATTARVYDRSKIVRRKGL